MVLASQAQHGMWITERVHGTGTAYHMPFALWFDGPLDREAMLAACASVVARHPVLSCVFEERDGELHLVPAAAKPPVEFLPGVPDPEAFVEREIARPFDLERGPLARFSLAGVSPERHLLLFVGHHLVFDGMSKDVLVRDLAAAYTGGPLSPLPLPYGGSGEVPAEAAAYWRERWREVPSVVVGGVPRAPRVAGRGETVLFDLTREMAAAAFDGSRASSCSWPPSTPCSSGTATPRCPWPSPCRRGRRRPATTSGCSPPSCPYSPRRSRTSRSGTSRCGCGPRCGG